MSVHTFAITGIKDFLLSADGREVTFALVTRYAGDLRVAVPIECLKDLQSSTARDAFENNAVEATSTEHAAVAENTTDNPRVKIPKTWSAAVDKQRGFVVVVLDHSTPAKFGFALHPDAAKKLAAALVKQADVIAASITTPHTIGLNP
jgi:hypothetical protein